MAGARKFVSVTFFTKGLKPDFSKKIECFIPGWIIRRLKTFWNTERISINRSHNKNRKCRRKEPMWILQHREALLGKRPITAQYSYTLSLQAKHSLMFYEERGKNSNKCKRFNNRIETTTKLQDQNNHAVSNQLMPNSCIRLLFCMTVSTRIRKTWCRNNGHSTNIPKLKTFNI